MKSSFLIAFICSVLFIASFGQSNNNAQNSNTGVNGNNQQNHNIPNTQSYVFNQGIRPYAYGFNTGIHPYSYSYNYPLTDNSKGNNEQAQNHINHQPQSINIPAQFQNLNNQPPIPFNFENNLFPKFDNNLNSADFPNMVGNVDQNLVNFRDSGASQLPAIPNIGGPTPPNFASISNLGGVGVSNYFNPSDFGLSNTNQANEFGFGEDSNNANILPNFGYQNNGDSGFPSLPNLNGNGRSEFPGFGSSNSDSVNTFGFGENQNDNSDILIPNFNTNSNSNNDFDFTPGSGSNILQFNIPLSSELKPIKMKSNFSHQLKISKKNNNNTNFKLDEKKNFLKKKEKIIKQVKKNETDNMEESSAQNWPSNLESNTPYEMLNLHPNQQNQNQGVYTNFEKY